MRRKLGNVEHAFTLNGRAAPLAAITVLQITPALDPQSIRQALASLQQRHPLLRATLKTEGSEYYFDIGRTGPTIPIEVIARRDEAHWQAVATAELNREIGQDGEALLRLTYLFSESDDPADLIFAFHHSIIDAGSGVRLVDQFLSLCTGETAAVSVARFLLPPVENNFPSSWRGVRAVPHMADFLARQMADEIRYRWHARGTRPQPIYPTAQCAILTRKLDVAATVHLTQESRRKRITLNNLLSAAMLLAVHHHLYNYQPAPLRAIMFGNLRPYLKPPVPSDDLGCMITMMRYTLQVEKGMNIWQLAGALQDKNNAAIHRGEKYLAAVFTKYIIQMTLRLKAFRLATTAVSYAGPLDLKRHYGSIEVTGMYNFVSNNRFGPEFVAAAHLLFGELVWNYLYLDSDMDSETAEAIVDEACQLLLDGSANQ